MGVKVTLKEAMQAIYAFDCLFFNRELQMDAILYNINSFSIHR